MYVLFFFLMAGSGFMGQTALFSQNLTPDKTVEISAVPGLRYDIKRITAEPGSVLEIVLSNDDDMMHNLLVVSPGTRERIVQMALQLGAQGQQMHYRPNSPNVLAGTAVIEAGEEARIIFRVPDDEGVYPYVCTFPGHGQLMYGALYVTTAPDDLPPVAEDPNLPQVNEFETAVNNSPHPYPMVMPRMNRIFMPNASPASIAVGMEYDQSYVWDAGYGYLRYAWSGGYIDAAEQFDRTSAEFAEVIGEIFYRNDVGFPFRTGSPENVPQFEFKGYRMMINGYPQFHYEMDGISVYELITPMAEGGLQITFSLENVDTTIFYEVSPENRRHVTFSDGGWNGSTLTLTPEQAATFTVTIRP